MSMQNKKVEVTHDIVEMDRIGIPAGLIGRVDWDEGGEDVIVEFDRDVPNGNLLVNHRQAWIARCNLKIIE